MFRRRAQRMIRRMTGQDVPPMLRRANQMMEAGDYANAASAFHQLAQGAEERFPQRAPFLYIEAGRAAILSGQTKTGISHLRRGLTLLADQRRYPRMQALGGRIVHELRERNLNAEAEEIEDLLNGNLPREVFAQPAAAEKRPTLPTHCPSCGAAIKPDEAEWLDEITAECSYCGSPVRGEA
ncbi:MAG: hypothetical protein AABZ00_00605 [Chloroflexota bacterium]